MATIRVEDSRTLYHTIIFSCLKVLKLCHPCIFTAVMQRLYDCLGNRHTFPRGGPSPGSYQALTMVLSLQIQPFLSPSFGKTYLNKQTKGRIESNSLFSDIDILIANQT